MSSSKSDCRAIRIIELSYFCLLIGRSWQYFFWDAPVRTLFWDQELMSGIVARFGISWNTFVTSPTVDANLNALIFIMGFLFLISAFSIFLTKRLQHVTRLLLIVASLQIIFFTILMFKEKFYQIGQLIEYASQLACPIILYLVLFKKIAFNDLSVFIKVAIALTFVGHGFYALGIHPQPGQYVDMILNVFSISELLARKILVIVGVLDLSVAILIFFPKYFQVSIWYIIIWAALTSLARVVAHIDFNFLAASMDQWLYEVLVRVPHFGLPLALWFSVNEVKVNSKVLNSA